VSLDPSAILSVGIAPPSIDAHAGKHSNRTVADDVELRLGQFNHSLGYHSNTGRVFTSWKAHANTLGLPYGKGNKIGIYVTYFGDYHSTVLIFYDHVPMATR
jgi:hypothetical protein